MNLKNSSHSINSSNPKTWLITGVSGFIGSNLLEELLKLGQFVIGLDNFSTGYRRNLEEVQKKVGSQTWARFSFIEGDIRNIGTCRKACGGVDYVLHQAALGSVPRSIGHPIETNESNVDGFLNMLVATRDAGINRFVYASSSSVYGDSPELPQVEEKTGKLLSPYAVSKYVNELYADVFAMNYGLKVIGLRYFNVFGKRQDPNGAYAAVIPKWISTLIKGERPIIHGDGETSRDFCYIDNVIHANLLSSMTDEHEALNKVYNIACGESTTLNELFGLIKESLAHHLPIVQAIEPIYGPFRKGDIRHSLADIRAAKSMLAYHPEYDVKEGLAHSILWYLETLSQDRKV